MPPSKLPKLPSLISRKIYKTGQTRGADDDVIYQNRVNRNSTVLIPFAVYKICSVAPDNSGFFENGFIVLIKPEDYFGSSGFIKKLESFKLKLGINALLFYETREQWNNFNPEKKKLKVASSRISPLSGEYIARVPSTTSANSEKISKGFNTSGMKGAGIRVYEYASSETIKKCIIQLEYLYWACEDSESISIKFGMPKKDIILRKSLIENKANELGLADRKKLVDSRILDKSGNTICPLCLERLSANGFYSKVEQAEGRDVPDLTVTQLNLFHIRELRFGEYNHKPYNLGWGHHHCNVVTKDSGIDETLIWMSKVIQKNKSLGYKIKRIE